MGLNKQPHYAHYYKPVKLYGNFAVGNVFRNITRYYEIKKYFKVEPEVFQQYLIHRFNKLWLPGVHMSIDETMIGFKGRFKYRQFVRGKPNSTGIKLYSCADSNGYLYNFFIYLGSNKNFISYSVDNIPILEDEFELHNEDDGNEIINDNEPDQGEQLLFDIEEEELEQIENDLKIGDFVYEKDQVFPSKPLDIVVFLASNVPNATSHVFYCDQFYGGLGLAHVLDRSNIKFVASCQSNRPTYLFKDYLLKGIVKNDCKYLTSNDGKIMAFSMFDKSKCSFISNNFTDKSSEHNAREITRKYNLHKGGVDLADSFFNRYMNKHRNDKWTQSLFMAMLNVSCKLMDFM